MGWEAIFTGMVVLGVLVGMAINLPADALIIGGTLLCGVAGILSADEIFAGFSNEGMLTVAALFVVTAGLRETGALEILGRFLLGKARTDSAVLRRMLVCVTGISAVLNNTPVVAMFMPIIMNWCQKNRVPVSRLLLPLSFFSVLGGCCTLIGTSTNLVVQGMLIEWHEKDPIKYAGLVPMSFFEIGYVGVPFAIIGGIYILIFAPRLLPDRKDFLEKMGETAREYLVNMQIQAGCPLIGKTVAEAGLRHLDGLFLSEIVRGEESIAPVRPDRVMHERDILTFTGVVNQIVELEKIKGLVPVADEGEERKLLDRKAGTLCEAVVSNTSPLMGKSIRESNFRALYNAAVIAVHRGGERMRGRVGDIELKQGDTLLLQAGPHFSRAHRNNADFFLVSGVEDSRPVLHEKALLSLGLTALLIVLLATGYISSVVAAFLIAGLMILTRCLSMGDARQSLDLQTLLTIAAAFGLGKAMVNSGMVGALSSFVVEYAGVLGPLGVLAGIYILSSAVTELVTNNAAAALMFPFAVEVAEQLDVSSRPFVIAVTLAASASFMTPIGYQTNLMVYGPGGYRFTDFLRIGTPLNILLFGVAMIVIPWPGPLNKPDGSATVGDFEAAIAGIDAANAKDPNVEEVAGEPVPKELIYGRRMSAWMDTLRPDAPEALRLAARAQHIRRWEVPRDSYPMDRKGYLQWRRFLYGFHGDAAAEILRACGYKEESIERVRFLLNKKQLNNDPDTQSLEDAACLVFLQHHLNEFASRTDEQKMICIIQKTWGKMSNRGRGFALTLHYSPGADRLLKQALSGQAGD